LAFPDRDYYFLPDEKSKQIRDEYVKHIAKYFTMMGDDEAKAADRAQTILKLESGLANASMTRVEQRDPYATYNKMSGADLRRKYPNINWDIYFSSLGIKPFDSLIVLHPGYFAQVNAVIKSTPVEDWKTYYRFHVINSAASVLSADYATEDFNFYRKTIQGIEQMDPRWKRVQDLRKLFSRRIARSGICEDQLY
jgi:putative endopeptidase